MEMPKRRLHRLPNYDYTSGGTYFVTLCTLHRIPILGSIQGLIRDFKSVTTRAYKTRTGSATPLWQKSFYDEVIRDERQYEAVWRYISENPQKWREDEYYALRVT